MKTILIKLVLMATSAYGFILGSAGTRGSDTVSFPHVMYARGTNSDSMNPTVAIKQAIETTKIYGATSYKAKLAWEVVEKIEYKQRYRAEESIDEDITSSEVTKKQEPTRVDVTVDDPMVVESNIRDLKLLLNEEMARVNHMRRLAEEIKVSSMHQSKL